MKAIKFLFVALIAIGALLVIIAWSMSAVRPVTWTPPPDPGLEGDFARNDRLAAAELVTPGDGFGPEDVTAGPDGFLDTGFDNGDIVRFRDDRAVDVFASTGGRPLGMQFDQAGNLIVADAIRGLLSISPAGEVIVLTDSVDGKKMKFVDDLDIAADGRIWFSDASSRFGYDEVVYDFIEASATGRLLSFDPASGLTTVHLEGLFFANGVALGPGDDYVLVSETGASRIRRLWLAGPLAGESDLFFNGLPAHPDNISFNGNGVFWVALPALRDAEFESLANKPFMRRLLGLLPAEKLGGSAVKNAFVVGISTDGSIVHNLQWPNGNIHNITSVNEWQGKLYLGTIGTGQVGVFDLIQPLPNGNE